MHDLQVSQVPEAGQPGRQLPESVVAQPESGQASQLAYGGWKQLQFVVVQQQLLRQGQTRLVGELHALRIAAGGAFQVD